MTDVTDVSSVQYISIPLLLDDSSDSSGLYYPICWGLWNERGILNTLHVIVTYCDLEILARKSGFGHAALELLCGCCAGKQVSMAGGGDRGHGQCLCHDGGSVWTSAAATLASDGFVRKMPCI